MTVKKMLEIPETFISRHAGHATMWGILGTNLLALQILFTPCAFATSPTPPTGISTASVNASTPWTITEGGEPTNQPKTGNPGTTLYLTSVSNNSSDDVILTTKLSTTNSSSEQFETVSLTTGFPISSERTDIPYKSTEVVTNLTTNLNTTTPDLNISATAKSQTSLYMQTFTEINASNGTTSNSEQFTTGTNIPSVTRTEQQQSTKQSTVVQTSANSSTTLGTSLNLTSSSSDVTSASTTAMKTSFTDELPTTPSVTRVLTTVLTSDVTISATSQEIITTAPTRVTDFIQPTITTPPQAQSSSMTSNLVTTVVVTKKFSPNNLSLTTEQLVGIVVGVLAVILVLVIVLCLLLWIRPRRNVLSKKPSIHVSKGDYSNTSTLALKDPQWRKSLTMALQSMNTHIELPKETDEQMQAIDNVAYVDESHEPGTSSEHPANLTKV